MCSLWSVWVHHDMKCLVYSTFIPCRLAATKVMWWDDYAQRADPPSQINDWSHGVLDANAKAQGYADYDTMLAHDEAQAKKLYFATVYSLLAAQPGDSVQYLWITRKKEVVETGCIQVEYAMPPELTGWRLPAEAKQYKTFKDYWAADPPAAAEAYVRYVQYMRYGFDLYCVYCLKLLELVPCCWCQCLLAPVPRVCCHTWIMQVVLASPLFCKNVIVSVGRYIVCRRRRMHRCLQQTGILLPPSMHCTSTSTLLSCVWAAPPRMLISRYGVPCGCRWFQDYMWMAYGGGGGGNSGGETNPMLVVNCAFCAQYTATCLGGSHTTTVSHEQAQLAVKAAHFVGDLAATSLHRC